MRRTFLASNVTNQSISRGAARKPVKFRSFTAAHPSHVGSVVFPSATTINQPNNSTNLDFDDVSLSFASKTTQELLRAYVVYRICTIRPIVSAADTLLSLSQKVLGRSITRAIIKPTFFSQFCAGESAADIGPTIASIQRGGLGAILDYAAEADADPTKSHVARPAAPLNEKYGQSIHVSSWEANAAFFTESIKASGLTKDGFASVKLTALTSPDLLIKLSDDLNASKRWFHFLSTNQAVNHRDIPHLKLDQVITLASLKQGLTTNNINLTDVQVEEFFRSIDTTNSGKIDFIQWFDHFNPLNSRSASTSNTVPAALRSQLGDEELGLFQDLLRRSMSLATAASENSVRLLVDAEQTYMQPAIDLIVLKMQANANRPKADLTNQCWIQNTYQCYLRDTASRIVIDYERATREGWQLGAKVVRGAYMRQERKRAADMDYCDPIQPNFEATSEQYYRVVDWCLQKLAGSQLINQPSATPALELVIAGHNESTVKWATARMAELNISRATGGVWFGQLLGMCDHVSYSLATNGYRVLKVCPYGPIEEVMPYLIRRAQENADVLERATKEMNLVKRELIRRKLPHFTTTPRSTPSSAAPTISA